MAGHLSMYGSVVNSPVPEKRKYNKLLSQRQKMNDAESQQTDFLAKDVPEFLLNRRGRGVNGYTAVPTGELNEPPPNPCLRGETFLKARQDLVTCCVFIERKHGKELGEMCERLDMDDEQLYSNYKTLLSTIWTEPRNWGRFASLFVATEYVCGRLGDDNRIASVLAWFSSFLKEHAVPWVKDNGGYVSRVSRE